MQAAIENLIQKFSPTFKLFQLQYLKLEIIMINLTVGVKAKKKQL